MSNVQDHLSLILPTGKIDGGTITIASGAATFDVAAGRGMIRKTNDADGSLVACAWPALAGNTISDGATKYVIVDNADGSALDEPTVRIASTDDSNGNNSFLLAVVMRVSTAGFTLPGKSALIGNRLKIANGIVAQRKYEALVTQSSTSAPTQVARTNEFGDVTFTWGYTSAGLYTLTASAPVFTANKTAVQLGQELGNLDRYKAAVTSTTVITITTNVISGSSTVTPTNALLTNSLLKITVDA